MTSALPVKVCFQNHGGPLSHLPSSAQETTRKPGRRCSPRPAGQHHGGAPRHRHRAVATGTAPSWARPGRRGAERAGVSAAGRRRRGDGRLPGGGRGNGPGAGGGLRHAPAPPRCAARAGCRWGRRGLKRLGCCRMRQERWHGLRQSGLRFVPVAARGVLLPQRAPFCRCIVLRRWLRWVIAKQPRRWRCVRSGCAESFT